MIVPIRLSNFSLQLLSMLQACKLLVQRWALDRWEEVSLFLVLSFGKIRYLLIPVRRLQGSFMNEQNSWSVCQGAEKRKPFLQIAEGGKKVTVKVKRFSCTKPRVEKLRMGSTQKHATNASAKTNACNVK